jgi:hypothetical protein
MSKALRPGRTLPVLLLLIVGAIFTFTFSGCGGHGDGDHEPPINEDSVKPHVIPLSLAIQLTKDFRSTVDTFKTKCPGFKDSLRFGYSEAFTGDAYRLLLRQKDSLGRRAAGIRIYYGRGKTGEVQLVLVPYDSSGNDIFNHLISLNGKDSTKVRSLTTDDGAQALEQGQHCPTICPPSSPLNP